MSLHPVFQTRDFSRKIMPDGISYEVTGMSWKVLGGSDVATISATGTRQSIEELIDRLRCPVDIYDDKTRWCWGGYINEVIITDGDLVITYSLDAMANRIAVAYSYIAPGGTIEAGNRRVTDWSTNTQSIAEYGTKDFLSSASGLQPTTAERRRDLLLDALGVPTVSISHTPGGAKDISAALVCRGWFNTLGWRTADVDSEKYQDLAAASLVAIPLGYDAARTKIAFPFTTGDYHTDMYDTGYQVGFEVLRHGSSDNKLTMQICADNAGVPGTAILSVASTDSWEPEPSSTAAWCYATFTVPANYAAAVLNPATTYWMVLAQSVAVNTSDYYDVSVDTDLTGAKQWGGAAWSSPADDYGILYSIVPIQRNTPSQHITDLVDNFGEFIASVRVMYTESDTEFVSTVHDGSETVLAAIEQICKSGTSSGRRIMVKVTEKRVMELYEEPAKTATRYISNDGILTTRVRELDYINAPTIGEWVQRVDMMPGTLSRLLTDPTLQFIDGAVWSNGVVQYIFRNSLEALDEQISGLTEPER